MRFGGVKLQDTKRRAADSRFIGVLSSAAAEVHCDFGRKSPLRTIILLAEGWERRIGGAFAQVLAFRYAAIVNPVPRVTAAQSAVRIPLPLNTVPISVPVMAFFVDAALIVIQPPIKAVPFPVPDVAGLA
jgi:hypothetical protein